MVALRAGSDTGADVNVWSIPLAQIVAKFPSRIALEPGFVLQSTNYIQYLWYHGNLRPSESLAGRFRTAHAAARGQRNPTQTATEQELLSTGIVLGTSPMVAGKSYAMAPRASMWLLGARFAATTLDAETVRRIARIALRPLGAKTNPHAVIDCNVSGVPVHLYDAAAQMLEWILNAPPGCAAYALCVGETAADDIVVETATGELDVDALERAVRTVIKPAEGERVVAKCISRIVCFLCGAHPLSRGIKLSACGDCEAVAYCSDFCAHSDWAGEHHRECARKRPRMSRIGFESLPARSLAVTRGHTEVLQKTNSMQTPVTVAPALSGMWAPTSISHFSLMPTQAAPDMTVFVPFWLVNGGAGGGLPVD